MRPIYLAVGISAFVSLQSCTTFKDTKVPETYFRIEESKNQFCATNVIVNHKVFAKNTHKYRTITFNFVSGANPVTLYPGETREIGCTLDPVTQRAANYNITNMSFVDVTYGDQSLNEAVLANRQEIDSRSGFEYTQCKQEAMFIDSTGALVCDPNYKETPWWKIWE